MKQQQVNLLAPMFRKQRVLFSARVTVLLCGLVTILLALLYAATAVRTVTLAAEAERLTAQRDIAAKRLNELALQLQGQAHDQTTDAQIAALTAERDRKAQALAALSQGEFGNTSGFSPQFIGLARQRLNGLWLTRIQVSGREMALDGVTLSEELIPKYLDKLGTESVFAGTEFAHAALERAQEGGNQIRFELRTPLALAGEERAR